MCYKFKWKILKIFLDLHIIMAVLIEQFLKELLHYLTQNISSKILQVQLLLRLNRNSIKLPILSYYHMQLFLVCFVVVFFVCVQFRKWEYL